MVTRRMGRPSRFKPKRYARWKRNRAARRIQRVYRRRRRGGGRLARVVKKVIHQQAETMHMDVKMATLAGSTGYVLPWGTDTALAKGTLFGNLLPVNALDRIIIMNNASPPGVGDPTRVGNSIYLKSIAVRCRIQCPEYRPAIVASDTAINRQGPETMAKCRLLVIHDNDGQVSLPVASTTTGVLSTIYDDLADCTAGRRSLPTFKGYATDKRYKILSQRLFTLNAAKVPYVDLNFTFKVNRKIDYLPSSNRALSGIYFFAMSDYPASTPSIQTQVPPKLISYWLRYYYTDL